MPVGNTLISRKRNPFNDTRLLLTYRIYKERLLANKTVSIRRCSHTESEANKFYRFLRNKKVNIPELIQMSCELPSGQHLEDRHVLVVGDSSSFKMYKHEGRFEI